MDRILPHSRTAVYKAVSDNAGWLLRHDSSTARMERNKPLEVRDGVSFQRLPQRPSWIVCERRHVGYRDGCDPGCHSCSNTRFGVLEGDATLNCQLGISVL